MTGAFDRSAFQRHNVAPGWAEIRLVVPVPEDDTREYGFTGELARFATIKWVLAYASGLASGYGWFYLESQLRDLWLEIEAKLRGGEPPPAKEQQHDDNN